MDKRSANPAAFEQAFRAWAPPPPSAQVPAARELVEPAPEPVSVEPVSIAPRSPSYAPAPYDPTAGAALNPYAHRSRPPAAPTPPLPPPLVRGPAPAEELSYQVYSAREASVRPRPMTRTDAPPPRPRPSIAAIVCMVLAGICLVFGTAALVILGTTDDAPTPKAAATDLPAGFPPAPALDAPGASATPVVGVVPPVPPTVAVPSASTRGAAPRRGTK